MNDPNDTDDQSRSAVRGSTAQRRTHVYNHAREGAHRVAVEEPAMREHDLLDDRPHVRKHQRPAKRTSILNRKQVPQKDGARVRDYPQFVRVAGVRRDVEVVARERRGHRDLLQIRLDALEVVRRKVAQMRQGHAASLQAILHAFHMLRNRRIPLPNLDGRLLHVLGIGDEFFSHRGDARSTYSPRGACAPPSTGGHRLFLACAKQGVQRDQNTSPAPELNARPYLQIEHAKKAP
jgi:hypothetical protein